jgi:Asp-tRNA(Asn)/Glu-tRNA(Gln) amidotransferase A subunit family amidase
MSKPETMLELASRLRRKEVSPLELTRACLDRIERLNSALNAFVTVMAESALAEARCMGFRLP